MYRSRSTGCIPASHSPPHTLWPQDHGLTQGHQQDDFPGYTNHTLASSFMDPSEQPEAQKQNCSESHLPKSLLIQWRVIKIGDAWSPAPCLDLTEVLLTLLPGAYYVSVTCRVTCFDGIRFIVQGTTELVSTQEGKVLLWSQEPSSSVYK